MKWTQVYIDEETLGRLKTQSRLRGVSISELIRESIHKTSGKGVAKIIRATDSVSGVWADRDFDVESFISSARSGKKK
jgi:hypothetical protein